MTLMTPLLKLTPLAMSATLPSWTTPAAMENGSGPSASNSLTPTMRANFSPHERATPAPEGLNSLLNYAVPAH